MPVPLFGGKETNLFKDLVNILCVDDTGRIQIKVLTTLAITFSLFFLEFQDFCGKIKNLKHTIETENSFVDKNTN